MVFLTKDSIALALLLSIISWAFLLVIFSLISGSNDSLLSLRPIVFLESPKIFF